MLIANTFIKKIRPQNPSGLKTRHKCINKSQGYSELLPLAKLFTSEKTKTE